MDQHSAGLFTAQTDSSCTDEQRLVCEWVLERTDSETWAQLADWFVDRPLRILFIIFLAWVVVRVLRRVVNRFAHAVAARSAEPPPDEDLPANPVLRRVALSLIHI